MPNRTVFAWFAATLLITAPAAAHDYWLQPEQFVLKPGDATDVRLLVGDKFVSEAERPFQQKMTVGLRLVARDRSLDLLETRDLVDGRKPLISVKPRPAGGHLVALERDWARIEIEAKKFEHYLEHEGLASIVEARRRAGESERVGRERYRRYLKALLQVGEKFDDVHARRLGHRLEIVLGANPCRAAQGDRLTATVLFDEEPLPDVQVQAYNRLGDDIKTQTARTDEVGRVEVTLEREGTWLIRLVHMRRCKGVEGVDWESFWSAYTFQLR